MRRHSGGDLLKAAEWFSQHTGKHVVVLSERLAHQLGGGGHSPSGGGGGGGGVNDAMQALAISGVAVPQCAPNYVLDNSTPYCHSSHVPHVE